MGKKNKSDPSSLDKQITELELEIKQQLEATNVIEDVRFHDNNYFSMIYSVYNNEGVRTIINECCEETIATIRKNVAHIKGIERKQQNGTYEERVIFDYQVRYKKPLICAILEELKKGTRKYLASNEHKKAITYYGRLRTRRRKVWD